MLCIVSVTSNKKYHAESSSFHSKEEQKHCKMRQIYMQKTLRNALNLHAKNTVKCGEFMCKKQCDMRNEFRGVFCQEI